MLDFIFPRVCPFCESVSRDGKICVKCLENIRFIKGRAICLKCGVPFGLSGLPDYEAHEFIGAVTDKFLYRCF